MDDDEWDLHALVRSCSTTSATTTVSTSTTHHVKDHDDDVGGSYKLESLAFGNEISNSSSSFLYPPPPATAALGFVSGGLEDVYTAAVCGHQQPLLMSTATTSAADAELADVAYDMIHDYKLPMLTDSHPMNNSQSTLRPRKRKNQEKTVFKLTEEELGNDMWAWRKYGQKPIKGSPFPRNYYRCSTTKACEAKKQVERSCMDASIFIVSYSGEHIHPRPTHRSSLAGSTRTNKFNTAAQHPPPCSSSSPAASAPSFSPTMSFKENDCDQITDEEDA